jgi:hypothetical protein
MIGWIAAADDVFLACLAAYASGGTVYFRLHGDHYHVAVLVSGGAL